MSFRMTGIAAAALLATTLAASAQSQTDSRGNAMGSQNVDSAGGVEDGMRGSQGRIGAPYGTTTGSSGRINGANHPTPSSTQGDVGPNGNNNGTQTGIYAR